METIEGIRTPHQGPACWRSTRCLWGQADRKSTRLNSSHGYIPYAVFCLKEDQVERLRLPVAGQVDLRVRVLGEHGGVLVFAQLGLEWVQHASPVHDPASVSL